MPSPYFVGYDGSAAATAAVRFAQTVARPAGADVTAVTVYRPFPHLLVAGATAQANAEINDELRHEAVETQAPLAGLEVRTLVTAGHSPAEALHRLAEVEDAAGLVVGATHRGAAARLVSGSVGERLLHGAPCPVTVVPAGWEAHPCATIAVAYDGRDEARAAVAAAESLARALDGRVEILSVHDPSIVYLPSLGGGPSSLDVAEDVRRAIAADTRHVSERVSRTVPCTWRLLEGPPATQLVDAVGEGIDLLVMGSRGYGPIRTALLGSVSRQVVDRCSCPVMVIPRSVRETRRHAAGMLRMAAPGRGRTVGQ